MNNLSTPKIPRNMSIGCYHIRRRCPYIWTEHIDTITYIPYSSPRSTTDSLLTRAICGFSTDSLRTHYGLIAESLL